MHASPTRRGSALLIVLGLLGVLLGLLLAVSLRVRDGIGNAGVIQRSVQAFIQLQAAKLEIQGRSDCSAAQGAVTFGGQTDLPARGHGLANAIGWGHVVPVGGNSFAVTANGGGGIQAGLPTGDPFQVRFGFLLSYNPAAIPSQRFAIVPMAVRSVYPW